MSVRVSSKILSDELVQKLKSELYVSPIVKTYLRGIHNRQLQSAKNGVSVYTYETQTLSEEITYYIPLFYARSKFGFTNDILTHAKVQMKFTGALRSEQKPYANDAINHLNANGVTILNSRPGFGKTTIATAISAQIGFLTVVLVHDKNQIIQWGNTYRERTTASVWMVGVDRIPPPTVDVIICLYTRTKDINAPLRAYVGTVIVDEAHEFCNETGVQSILDFQPKFVVACTATFKRTDGMEKAMELIVGNAIVGGEGPLPFRVIKVKTPFVGIREKANGTLNWTILNQSIIYNNERNKEITKLVITLLNNGRKILLMCNEVNHASTLHNFLKEAGIQSCDYLFGNKSSYNDSSVLIGTHHKIGTGFDEAMLCSNFGGKRIDTVVIVGSFRDIPLLYQVVGRAFRADDPLVVHMVDNDRTIQSQWSSCLSWYKLYALSITETDLATAVANVQLPTPSSSVASSAPGTSHDAAKGNDEIILLA